MNGEVTPYSEARILLKVQGPAHTALEISCVIDTGFAEYLTLPPTVLAKIRAPKIDVARFQPGDGSMVTFDIHSVTVSWHSMDREIPVSAAEGGALIGMAILYGSELSMTILDGGWLTITPVAA